MEKSQKMFSELVRKIALIGVISLLFGSLTSVGGCQKNVGKLPLLYEQSDWQRMGLYGNVSSLTLYELDWEEAFGSINLTSPATVDQSTNFNVKGNQVDSIYYDMNGRPKNKDVFIYDTDEETWLECKSYTLISRDKTDTPQSGYTNFYDANDKLYRIEGHDYGESGVKLSPPTLVHVYEYLDETGKIVRTSYEGEGSLQWKNISEYDSDTREIASIHYDKNGAVQWNDKFKYDDKRNRIEWSRYDSKGALQWKDVLKYDDNGNETECANYDYRNILMWKDIYVYIDIADLQGFDIAKSLSFESKFDGKGNWIVKLTLEQKEGFGSNFFTVKEIEQRSITYFP